MGFFDWLFGVKKEEKVCTKKCPIESEAKKKKAKKKKKVVKKKVVKKKVKKKKKTTRKR